MARLGELLLLEKLITPAQLEEALETQVIHGGRLGTNLCELGFVQEKDLARVLGSLHSIPYAFGEMLPDPQAVALFTPAFLDDNDVMPMRVEPTRLTVAVLGPNQIKAIDAIAFKAGRRVVQVVIPEFRMNQLLRKCCKAFRPLRPIDMNTLRQSKRTGTDDGPKPGEASELINEDDFAALYAKAAVGEVVGEAEEAVIEGVVIEDVAPEPVVAPPPALVPTATPAAAAPPKPPPEPQLPPLTFAEAQALLQKSANRDDIALTVLRFARGKFRRALLLSVQGDLVMGWRGLGLRVDEKKVQRIGVSLREQNTFKLVRDLRSHFVGPMKQSAGTDMFYKLLGGKYPETAVMMPLLVRGKPVHLLYVDQGPKQVTPPDVGELLIVSQGVTRSYEALIRARQGSKAP